MLKAGSIGFIIDLVSIGELPVLLGELDVKLNAWFNCCLCCPDCNNCVYNPDWGCNPKDDFEFCIEFKLKEPTNVAPEKEFWPCPKLLVELTKLLKLGLW